MPTYWELLSEAAAHWPLQETEGTTAADLAGSYPAPLEGGFEFSTSGVAGPTGWLARALQFDGVDDLVVLPSPLAMGLGASHTIAFWVKIDRASPWSDEVLFEMGGSIHATSVELKDANIYLRTIRNNVVAVAGGPAPTYGSWFHFAAVLTDSSLKIYLNGLQAYSAVPAASWVADGDNDGALGAMNGGNWSTGATTGVAAYFNGAMASVLVFTRALDADEVVELFQGPEPTMIEGPTLVGTGRVGDPLNATSGEWGGHSNGILSTGSTLQRSADGVSGWSELPGAGDIESLATPASTLGDYLRCTVTATNAGGSTTFSTDPILITAARSPGSPVAGAVSCSGAELGQTVATAGVEAGIVLPGGQPTE